MEEEEGDGTGRDGRLIAKMLGGVIGSVMRKKRIALEVVHRYIIFHCFLS